MERPLSKEPGPRSSPPETSDLSPATPRSQASKATTASQLLAMFSPSPPEKKTHTTKFKPHNSDSLEPSPFPLIMEAKRPRRVKKPISYEISSGSEDELGASKTESCFSTPRKQQDSILNLTEDEGDELAEQTSALPPPRVSTAGHSLRQPQDLHLSLRAQENALRPYRKMRALGQLYKRNPATRYPTIPKPRIKKPDTTGHSRTVTNPRKEDFLIAHKDIFLPLLPEENLVQKMVDDRENRDDHGKDSIVPYETFREQPAGVKASMKPYQLLGLSFLVFMHRNAVSGILGDEMGLGKTLQTLAFLQYLKEQSPKTDVKQKPSLVVCPLSVLSSWMAEAAKWTPGLKVIRFHGPVAERDRLKKIVAGNMDKYGVETKQARMRRGERRSIQVQPLIDLDREGEGAGRQQTVDVVCTTYEGFLAEQSYFKRACMWKYIILDEGHKIKNDVTLVSKALQGLRAENRLILTGTPLQNNMTELWALLHWLYPDIFTERSNQKFKDSFNLSKGKVDTGFMDDARRLLEVIMLRRMKSSPGVDLNLPPKKEVLLYVPLTPMQKFYYLRLLTRADQALLDDIFNSASEKEAAKLLGNSQEDFDEAKSWDRAHETCSEISRPKNEWTETQTIMQQAIDREKEDEHSGSAWRKLMNILMQLRKCCNHPYTLPNAAPDPYYIGEHVVTASAKFILLDKIIAELVLGQKKKILVFSGFTKMLDCCEDLLLLRGGNGEKFKYSRLDGASPRARRNLNIRVFNQEQSDYRVMLISTKAGGLGINLAAASDVVLLDQEWNPQLTLQAESRAHRIGQKQPVTVYKLCTQGTVEEQMMSRIQKKLYLSAKVTESMRDIRSCSSSKNLREGRAGSAVKSEDDVPQLGTSELMSLVRRGAQTLAHPELNVSEMLSWDWKTTLEKCKDRPSDAQVSSNLSAESSRKEELEKDWLAKVEQVQSRVFEGKKHSKSSLTSSFNTIAQEWSRESRRLGKNTTVLVDGFEVSKESLNCKAWEAVPTLAGKDPKLAELSRGKRAPINNQDLCQACWDGGELVICSLCPRSFHHQCLDAAAKTRARSKINFSCSQHQCVDCSQKTTDAGGMLFRCRWCPSAYCEDCLDWDKSVLLGESLKEYEILGFPAVTQAFYIECPKCTVQLATDESVRTFCNEQAAEIDDLYEDWKKGSMSTEQPLDEDRTESVEAPSLDSDGLTLESSGIMTPRLEKPTPTQTSIRKRKATQGHPDSQAKRNKKAAASTH